MPMIGLEAGLACLLLELPGGVHVAVIGDRQRRLLELLRAPDQVIDAVRAVEERVLGVAMQVDERHKTDNLTEHDRYSRRTTRPQPERNLLMSNTLNVANRRMLGGGAILVCSRLLGATMALSIRRSIRRRRPM